MLLKTASESPIDLDDCLSLTNLAVTHLREERFQKAIVRSQALAIPLALLARSYSLQASLENSTTTIITTPSAQTAEEKTQTSAMRSHIIQVLSDISALPEFATTYPVGSGLTASLSQWLSTPQSQLQVCACIMLGNLARSDEACKMMVHRLKINESLIRLLQDSDDTQVLYSAAGFLKNLALLSENKAALGETSLIDALPRLWTMETVPQVQHAGASLTRQLVSNSFDNVRRLLRSLSPDPDSPAHEKTYLSLLLSLDEKSDDPSTKIEIARTITAICRVLNSPHQGVSSNIMQETAYRLYSLHPDIARPLAAMVSQSRWPVIRSEGWFAFALMARSREGSLAVSEVVQAVDVFQSLVETITGQPFVGESGGQASRVTAGEEAEDLVGRAGGIEQERQMRARDRDNALVLVSELLKNTVSIRRFRPSQSGQGREFESSRCT